MSFRATDRVVMQTRRPLSVSTDKLGVTAMRCAYLLHRWSAAGEAVDRAGGGRFVEVYPAGALVRWGMNGSGYRSSDKAALRALVAAVCDALPLLELTAADRRFLRREESLPTDTNCSEPIRAGGCLSKCRAWGVSQATHATAPPPQLEALGHNVTIEKAAT